MLIPPSGFKLHLYYILSAMRQPSFSLHFCGESYKFERLHTPADTEKETQAKAAPRLFPLNVSGLISVSLIAGGGDELPIGGDEEGLHPIQAFDQLHAFFRSQQQAGGGQGVSLAELSERMVTDARPVSAGNPVKGSSTWWYSFPL